ncbi:MAG: HD-GYP domain-containing protein [Sphingomonas sp.]
MPGGPPVSDNIGGVAPGRSDVILSADWRARGSVGHATQTASSSTGRSTSTAAARLHLHARRASPREERVRAKQIVGAAKAAIVDTFEAARFGGRLDVAQLAPVVEGIAASIARDPIAIPSVTRLKSRHEYTYLHSVAVCGLMISLARELGLDPGLTHDIGMAGLLHDVGKARVPTLLLDKPGSLTNEEFAVVRSHAERGVELLVKAGGIPDIALDVCAHHHERVDGSGYPFRLKGAELSIFARMGAICDVYDAVTSERAYKEKWSPGEALDWMSSVTGHFDRSVLGAFAAIIGAFPPGSLVRLQSDRLAVVLDEADADPLNPGVCVFLCANTRRPLPWQRCTTDPIVGIERADRWALPLWDQTRRHILAHFATSAAT